MVVQRDARCRFLAGLALSARLPRPIHEQELMSFTGFGPAGRLGIEFEYDILDRGAHLASADLDRDLADTGTQLGEGDGLHMFGDTRAGEIARMKHAMLYQEEHGSCGEEWVDRLCPKHHWHTHGRRGNQIGERAIAGLDQLCRPDQ